MPAYRTTLVAGRRKPYDTWTFAVVPEAVHRQLGGKAHIEVRGSLAGIAFRATVRAGEGVYRFPVVREVREAAGVGVGDTVDITIDADHEPRPIEVPEELQTVLEQEGLAAEFARMAPSHRRAWAQFVAEAKQPATRARRASKAPAGIRARRFPGQH
ncbi:MAG: DUF1905 domain-containing protein [Planctomycetes bacterium]|nr:DUF1905 domain-containing protein [Planctomycetota bacterium]